MKTICILFKKKEKTLKKLNITTALFLIFSLSSIAMPQNVRDIMARYYRAMGGLKNLRAWKSMKASGRYVLAADQENNIPFTVYYKAPDKTRLEMSINGQPAVYVVTGETAWMCDPSRGIPDPVLMPEEQAREAVNNADVYPFIDYKKKGHKVEFLGTEEFEGHQVYRVKLIQRTGVESEHLFDTRTGRELKIIIKTQRAGKDVIMETIERKFRNVDWLLLPFLTETHANGMLVRTMLIESVEIDPVIDDSLFIFPGPIK
jgi:outer membrane lipoprotein-sorting protein